MGERTGVLVMACFVVGVFVLVIAFSGFDIRLTGYAVFSDVGNGQTNLILQDAGTDNLGDAYVEKSTGNRNHGDKDELKVQKSAWQRSYLNFDISAIPVSQVIDEASLCLFLDNDQGDQTISINHVYDDGWCEGDGGTDASPACEITWNNQPCGVDELVIGGDCNASVEDVFVTDTDMDDSWHCFDIVEMLSNDYGDDEISMVLWTVDAGSADIFASKENVDTSLRPYLNVTYHAANEVPVVGIDLPVDGANYNYNESLSLNFSVVDDNLDSCWYNIDDGVNVSLDDCLNSSFDVSDGAHILRVYVNDSFGLEVSDSVSFNVDVGGVFVSISEPVGEKDSRSGIDISYSVSGADECWYNVETSIGGVVIENTTLVDCNSSSFDVSADGDYVLNLFGNNSLGSSGFDSSSFSVDTSEDPVVVVTPPSRNSGGSSGGTVTGGSGFKAKLEVDAISAIVSIGEEKSLVVNVKNVGRVSANKCSLVSDGDIDSVDILNIGVGEIVEFRFVLSVQEGVEDLGLSVKCLDNVSAEVPLGVVVLRPELDVSIGEISFVSEKELLVVYSIEPVDSGERVLYFRIINSDGGIVKEISQDVSLVFGEIYYGEVLIDISDVDEGMLKISVGNSEEVSFIEEDFIYGGGVMTGLVGLNIDGTTVSIGLVVFVFLIAAGFILWRIWKLHREK